MSVVCWLDFEIVLEHSSEFPILYGIAGNMLAAEVGARPCIAVIDEVLGSV